MGKKATKMTAKQYEASEHNTDMLSYPAITKRLREGRSLPNVRKSDKFGDVFMLQVEVDKK
jgi:hypothetical protein